MKSKTRPPKRETVFKKTAAFLQGYGVKHIAVFGSFARGDQKGRSDLDLLVEFTDRKSLLDWIGIEQELSEFLGIKVDLLSEESISPYLIDRIRQEMVILHP